jgi:cytochrome P450
LKLLMAGLGIFSPKTIGAFQDLLSAYRSLVREDFEDTGQVFKERVRVLTEYKVPEDDIARMSIAFSFGMLSNTAPTIFWILYDVLSRPELLHEIRQELEEQAVTGDQDHSRFELDVDALKTKCPLLLSTIQETQRTKSSLAIIRKVMEDSTLDTYSLQKGSYLQIPSAPIHRNADLWGADQADFNPRRFVNNDARPSNAFLAWGTAPHLCPARQWAATELLIMTALVCLRIEIEPVPKGWFKIKRWEIGPLSAKWKSPALKYSESSAILPPKDDIEVNFKPRAGWNGDWTLKMGESNSKIALASG